MLGKKKKVFEFLYKSSIALICMTGILFFLISCGKEDKTVLQSEENDVSKKNVVKSEIQTDTLEGAGIKGNYYEGEYEIIPEEDVMELVAISDMSDRKSVV